MALLGAAVVQHWRSRCRGRRCVVLSHLVHAEPLQLIRLQHDISMRIWKQSTKQPFKRNREVADIRSRLNMLLHQTFTSLEPELRSNRDTGRRQAKALSTSKRWACLEPTRLSPHAPSALRVNPPSPSGSGSPCPRAPSEAPQRRRRRATRQQLRRRAHDDGLKTAFMANEL